MAIPTERDVHCFKFKIALEFGSVGFVGGRKIGGPRAKLSE